MPTDVTAPEQWAKELPYNSGTSFRKCIQNIKQNAATGVSNRGDVFDYEYGKGHIYNLGTQVTWRTKAKLEYIEQSIRMMLILATQQDVTKIALPAIGAGLGGLKWDDVKDILYRISESYPNVDLYVVESYQSGHTTFN